MVGTITYQDSNVNTVNSSVIENKLYRYGKRSKIAKSKSNVLINDMKIMIMNIENQTKLNVKDCVK